MGIKDLSTARLMIDGTPWENLPMYKEPTRESTTETSDFTMSALEMQSLYGIVLPVAVNHNVPCSLDASIMLNTSSSQSHRNEKSLNRGFMMFDACCQLYDPPEDDLELTSRYAVTA